ncbi:hypothetical protein [Actinomadura harenae]|uniref:hypothetical protein n=1 Tax=Actinomadura harenae TaxID=2483351 RepID=UPI001F2923DA|nr:hypothetical protein [Actinomadura harenae]
MWAFATPEERAWWSGTWGGRMVKSSVADQAVANSHATRDDLERIHQGRQEWATAPDGAFCAQNGEIPCRA